MLHPGVELGVRVSCFFTKIIFKLTIDISMDKIMLEVGYFIKKYDLSNVKIFQGIAYFIPR